MFCWFLNHTQDMSRVNGKNRKELLAMAKVQVEGKKGRFLFLWTN